MLIGDIVRGNAEFFGERDAVVVPGGRTVRWGELDARTNRMARALQGLGLGKGDRVAMFASNCPEYVDFYFACGKTGIIGAATNIRLSPYELTSYLSYVGPKALIVHEDVADLARKFLDDLPSVRHVIGIGPGHGFDLDLDTVMQAEEPTDPGIGLDESDIYQLGATSGTTGVPKGTVLTHGNAIAAMLNWLAEIPIQESGTNLQNISMFFNPGGPASLHPVLMKGGRTVITPAFHPGTFLRLVPEYGVTHSILVPTMIQLVVDHPECGLHDLSTIQGITCGGSPVPQELLMRARAAFGNVFFPFYGMAETYSCGLALRREDQVTEGTPEQVRRLMSAGKPHVLMQVRVVGEEGVDVPHDNSTPGEIWMKGDTVSPAYFEMPEETAEARDGEWFKSGDVAVIDEEGFVTIVDRKKDMIITGGINVFSREVEEVLYRHPAVAQAAVIGIPHETWGETIHAVVTLKAGTSARPEEIMAFAAEKLTHYKKPRSVEIAAELPIGGTGKILKKELRARYWEDHGRAV